MKLFNIRFRRGPDLRVRAYAYTEDTEIGRFLFHRVKDKSDRDNFFLATEVTGVSEIDEQKPFSLEEFAELIKDEPK